MANVAEENIVNTMPGHGIRGIQLISEVAQTGLSPSGLGIAMVPSYHEEHGKKIRL